MQTVALGWLVLELTGSGTAVGATFALQFLPMLLFGLWGGLIADRYDKRTTLMFTQSAMALVALTLWIVASTGAATVWVVYLLVFAQGLVTVVDNPTRQSFVTEMVGRDQVANAVSLNSALFNAGRIIGPSLAGVTIATIGLHWTFLINAVSFVAVLAGLKAMDPRRLEREVPTLRAPGQVREGLAYVMRVGMLRNTLLLVAVFSLFALNFSVVLPLLAKFTFDSGAGTFGFLTSMMAAGALLGALAAAARRRPTKVVLVGSLGAFGVLALAAAAAPSIAVLAALLVPIGAATITFISTANATLQLRSDATMRGRVMALHGLVFLGSTPIGAPLIGWVSEVAGPRWGLAVGGGMSLVAALAALVFIKRDQIERRLRVMVQRRPIVHLSMRRTWRKAG